MFLGENAPGWPPGERTGRGGERGGAQLGDSARVREGTLAMPTQTAEGKKEGRLRQPAWCTRTSNMDEDQATAASLVHADLEHG